MNWNEIPSLSALRAFEAVARHETLTAAAQSLNVTHAAVTQHIKGLEGRLGVPLTQKAGRGLVLTPEGRQLADALSDGFGAIHAGIQTLTQSKEDKPIAITATPSFAENWLLPRLGSFWAAHPDIMVSITPDFAVIDLNRDPYDMAIRYGRGDWPNLSATFLVSADYVVVAAPSLLKGREVTGMKCLQDLPWLLDVMHREPRRWAIESGLDFECCQVKEFQTLTMTLSALRAGVGVSVVSRALVETDIKNGTLIEVADIPSAGMGYYIAHLDRPLSTKAKTFKKWMLSAV